MKIDILCRDGSPIGVSEATINGEDGQVGVGGAELALLTMCKGWHDRGDEVVLYNNPRKKDGSCFEQRDVSSFVPQGDRDVLIVFRSPNPLAAGARGLRVWWSCDQYTIDSFQVFSKMVDKVVTISPYHSEYFKKNYGIENSIPIDLPVRTWEYEQKIEKVPNRLIFNSVPDRGLRIVAETFPAIKIQVPDVSLVITSDYRLWGAVSPTNSGYVQMFMRMDDVEFLGAVSRKRLIEEELKAQIHYYPCTYEELFCISVAESQVAGAMPITNNIGALKTTNMALMIDGDANNSSVKQMFIDQTVKGLRTPTLNAFASVNQSMARDRFSLEKILRQWDEKVFNV